MNRLVAILIFGALAACKPPANIVPADFIELAPPHRPKIELYINKYKLGPSQGSIVRPGLSQWKPDVKTKHKTSTNEEGLPPYTAALEYLGRKPNADVYSVTITHPVSGGNQTFTKEIRFTGEEVEIFKDDEYRIGLRLAPENEG